MVSALLVTVTIAVPTDLIETPLFSREVPPTPWAWPVLAVTAALSGLLTATYVARPAAVGIPRSGKFGMAGALLSFFAVGCPVCNKLVLLVLGASGAMQYFEPIQPYLAGASIGIMVWALWRRITNEDSCPVPRIRPELPSRLDG
ncbi:hypothetical protein [Leifsonia sp. SIMBA_070]|uniref:hypothetical protein n=1 Tax=Leifsonia sp. SIMBA_070 TaxID=3085810 RepID=UPI00397D43C7